MVYTPFSGAWSRTKGKGFFQDPEERLHTSDARHYFPGHDQEPGYTYAAPPAESLGYDVRETWGTEYVVNTGGDVLSPDLEMDYNAKFQGEGGTLNYIGPLDISRPGGQDAGQLSVTLPKHARDLGANRQLNTPRYRELQQAHESYGGTRIEGFGPEASAVSDEALRRGLSADPVNNPPDDSYEGHGYRFGWTEQSWVDRKLVGQGLNMRVNDERMWTLNLADVAVDAPPPPRARQNPYTVPFSSLQRAVKVLMQRPTLRRMPDPDELTETSVETSGEVYTSHLGSWWGAA